MQLSNTPGKLLLPFAADGTKNAIPVDSQIGIVAGKASLADGFPPLTRTPLSAGGVPPSGLDMNGILYEMSDVIRWANAGGGYAFDATFATNANVGGYPKGARVMRSDGLGYWLNTVENNETDPEAAGAAAAGWVPDFTSGATAVTMTNANVTLTPLQYGKPVIVISGLLTANLNLIFPDIPKSWAVVNNTTGAYSITCKTASGTGVILSDTVDQITGDGVNIYNQNNFVQAGVGAVERTFVDKMRERVSVKDFGASTSASAATNTAAIQAALNAAKHITFGDSSDSYQINGTLTLSSGQELTFCGATITQTANQTPMFNAASTDNVTIRGGRFVGKSEATFTNTASSQAICITASNATDLLVTENRFENFYYSPIMINAGGNRVEFSNNFIKGPGSAVLGADVNYRNCTGATITGSNIRIHGNDIYDTAQGLIIGQGSTRVSVTGNVIHGLINEHGIYADTGIKGLSIVGNTIYATGVNGTGVKVQHYDSFGVRPEDITISGNAISNTGSDGILIQNTVGTTLYASGVAIVGNTIYQAGQHGIDVRYARGCVVSGNSIEQSVQSGLYLANSQMIDVVGNSIRITGSHGIFDNGTSGDVTYANNLINTPGTNPANDCGILVQGVSEHVFVGNVIRGTPAKMMYGLFISAATSLITTEVRSNSITGAANNPARFPTGVGQLRYFGENLFKNPNGTDGGFNIPETLQRGSEVDVYYGTGIPVSGTWPQGAKIYSKYPAAGGFLGWVCVVGGTPGTWKTFGPVTA